MIILELFTHLISSRIAENENADKAAKGACTETPDPVIPNTIFRSEENCAEINYANMAKSDTYA